MARVAVDGTKLTDGQAQFEDPWMANGDSYMGPYSVTIYPGSPDNGTEFNESGTPLVTFTGTITAKRVTAH
jgi:hypothetical protein